jgi:hypothetical protein
MYFFFFFKKERVRPLGTGSIKGVEKREAKERDPKERGEAHLTSRHL